METSMLRHTVRHKSNCCLALLMLASTVALATTAEAQSVPAKGSSWDVSFVAGYLGVRPEIELLDRYADRWYDAGQAGVALGRYFTPNLKAEVELSTSTEGRQWITRHVTLPGASFPLPYGTERFGTLREVSASLVYQFFENEWAHPFVLVGVAGDFDRVRSYTARQTYFVGDSRLPPSQVVVTDEIREGPETTTHARVLFGGGGKFYANQQVFVRADGRFGTGQGGRHVAFRLGVGVDF